MATIEIEPLWGHCTTNLDDYRCDLKVFARVPNIGECVAVTYKGRPSTLKVCQITHDVRMNKPYIIVELTK